MHQGCTYKKLMECKLYCVNSVMLNFGGGGHGVGFLKI